MKKIPTQQNPLLLYLFAIPLAIFNFLTVINPLIIEPHIIGAPIPLGSDFDIWILERLARQFTIEGLIANLLVTYIVSSIAGALIAYSLLRSSFRKLLKENEVVISAQGFGLRLVIDIMVILFAVIALDHALAYVLEYPRPLASVLLNSSFSAYAFTGFITGSGGVKCSFPLRLQRKASRKNLRLAAYFLVEDDSNKRRKPRLIQWALVKNTG